MWTAQAVFICALGLLGRSPETFPATQLVETAPIGASRFAAAYVSRDDHPRIVLITSTAAFMAARRAKTDCADLDAIREIAGVLAHEEWHLKHGPDEEGVYDAQLTMLSFVGADPDGPLYHKVKQAKLAVLARSGRAAQAPAVARGMPPASGETLIPSRPGLDTR